MVFGVIGFGLTTTALLVTFARFFTRNWFPYFMIGLVVFEIGMFTLTKCKTIEPERPLVRTEKSDGGSNRAPPPSPGANGKTDQSTKNQAASKSQSPAKGQAANNKREEKAAKKAQAKATPTTAK